MTLQQMRYAVEIADCGSINEAAKKLFISQPSLSGTMKDLENELDITTYTKDPAVLQGLYDEAIKEYEAYREDLLKFCGEDHCLKAV